MHKYFSFVSSLVIIMLWGMVPAAAQGIEFESQLIQRRINCILEQGDKVIGGLDGGGLLIWDRLNPAQVTRLSAGEELSANLVTDLAWTGRHIWVATLGGGMTRITNFDTEPEYRQYASNLGSLDITAVTGQVINDSEKVFYGMDEGGLGLITDGLGGAIYTAEQDDLIDNNINDLQLFEGDLFVATPLGISRFANNLFTDQNEGLSNLDVTDLVLDPDGNLVAGGQGGIYVWDVGRERWNNLSWTGNTRGISSNGTQLWALGWSTASYYNGSGWTAFTLPYPGVDAIEAGQNIWIGGRWRSSDMNAISGLAWYGAFDGQSSFSEFVVDASLVYNGYGLDFDHNGTVWTGSYLGKAIAGLRGDEVHNIYQLASAENDSNGLFAYGSNILSLVADHERGLIYAGQITKGIVRYEVDTGQLDLMYGGTCGLEETPGAYSSMISLEAHPDGTLLVMFNADHPQKVKILTDPIHWRGDANWYDVPQGNEGIGLGEEVWDAVVQRNDVIWFAVAGTGLMRWDINGNSAGPDDELTWSDFTDDRWDGPFAEIEGTNNNPTQAKTRLALAPDGTVWFGGNGITRFSFNETFGTVKKEEAYGAKTAAYMDGLIDGNVMDLEVDSNGDLWVSTRLGLNLVRWGTREPEIEAYFDLANYFSNSAFALLYSPNVITGLQGGVYTQLAASADRSRMALTSTQGTVAWDITAAPGETHETLASLYCYPNPWTPDAADSQLKLGGISADAVNDDPAKVEVYNLEGQLVYRNSYVSAESGFWNGQNRTGQPVATGMYVVKVNWRGLTTIRTLAVVR